MRNPYVTSIDQPLLDRMSFDSENDAWRVSLVSGGNIEVKADASEIGRQIKEGLKDIKLDLPEQKLETIQIPTIITEKIIEKIEVPVIVKEIEIKEIEKQVLIKEVEIKEIEKPVIVTEYKTIEIPVILEKVEEKVIKSIPIWTIATMVVELCLILVLLIAKK